jgi:tetratricopeptide (TPR) repeat protein
MRRGAFLLIGLSLVLVIARGGAGQRLPSARRPAPRLTGSSGLVPSHQDARLNLETKKESPIEQFAADLDAVRSVAVDAFLLLLLPLAVVIIVRRELRRRSVIIDRIDVPRDLAEKGYSSEVIAQRIAAHIVNLRRSAQWGGRVEEGYEVGTAQSDFTVPIAGFSYRLALRYARQLLDRPEERVQGEVVRDGDAIKITLRTRDRRQTPASLSGASESEIDDLLKSAAMETAILVDPHLVARYWFGVEQRERKFEATFSAVRQWLRSGPANSHYRAYLVWGDALVVQRRLDEAEEKYRHATAAPRSQSAWLYNSKGNLLRARRRYDDAAAQYRKATHLDYKQASLWCNLGNVCNDRHDARRALGCFERAIRLDPGYARGWSGRGLALARLARHEEAEQSLERAVDLDPTLVWSYLNWALLLVAQHRNVDAIDKTRIATKKTANLVEARALRGDILVMMERFEEADENYRSAIDADAGLANGLGGLAFSCARQRRYDAAIGTCKKALSVDRYYINAVLIWADSLRSLGHHDKAIEKYREALEMDRYQSRACVGWAQVLQAKQQWPDAVSKLKEAIRIDAANAWAWQAWGDLLIEMQLYPEAIRKFRSALAANPYLSDAHRSWGAALEKLDRFTEAIEEWLRAVQVDPQNADALTACARGLRLLAQKKASPYAAAAHRAKAGRLLRQALAASRVNSRPRRELGWLLLDLERPVDALGEFHLAGQLDTKDAYSWKGAGDALEKLERPAEALDKWRCAARIDPENPDMLTACAHGLRLLAKEDASADAAAARRTEAARLLRQALDAKQVKPWSRRERGWLAMDLGDEKDALREFELAVELDRKDGHSWKEYGRVLGRLGKAAEARAAWEKAEPLLPGDKWLREKLRELRRGTAANPP